MNTLQQIFLLCRFQGYVLKTSTADKAMHELQTQNWLRVFKIYLVDTSYAYILFQLFYVCVKMSN